MQYVVCLSTTCCINNRDCDGWVLMEYRLNKKSLLEVLSQWNGFLKRKVHLIACGGTALTLQGIKASTKDVDLIVPVESEYKYLTNILEGLGYQQVSVSGWRKKQDIYVFDLFKGKRIHTTELLDSPLDPDKHVLIKQFSHLYLGVLNDYDLIVSKLFRGATVDFEDCLMLAVAHRQKIDFKYLEKYYQTSASYDVSQERIGKHFEHFMRLLEKEGVDYA